VKHRRFIQINQMMTTIPHKIELAKVPQQTPQRKCLMLSILLPTASNSFFISSSVMVLLPVLLIIVRVTGNVFYK